LERKTVIRRAAIVGALVFVTAAILLIAIDLHKSSVREQDARDAEGRAAELRKEYQAYLDQTAQKIQALPADPRVVGEIQTRHYRALPATSLYVWASTNEGEFSFGVPVDSFARLNAAYDHHRALITRENHYANRDQFLRTLLHHDRAISLRPKEDEDERQPRGSDDDWWHYRREETDPRHNGGATIAFLSSPIQDAAGKTVGNLNLKLVDTQSERSYSFLWHDGDKMLAASMALSFFWLWFLLPSWVYIDARERDVPRPLLWAFLTLVGNAFALVVYLISRPAAPATKELFCPRCHKALNGAKAGCPYCGADLSSAFCQQCQYPLRSDWSFCPACRTGASKTSSPTEATG
jgi:RNA polymerase subunit RPABC4/transcription elongation factor Spt4